MNDDCVDWDFVLKLLAVAAGTYFWMNYIVFELEQRAKEAKEKNEKRRENERSGNEK